MDSKAQEILHNCKFSVRIGNDKSCSVCDCYDMKAVLFFIKVFTRSEGEPSFISVHNKQACNE